MKLWYAALDSDGSVMGVEASSDAATEIALELAPGTTVQVQTLSDARENPPAAAEQMPVKALRACRIPVIDECAALTMNLTEAWERLHPFFKGLLKRGAETHRYDTPAGMSKAWIGQNYKTKKQVRGQHSKVMGLTLVPAKHPRLAAQGAGPYVHLRRTEDRSKRVEALKMIDRWHGELSQVEPDEDRWGQFNLCVGSSENCRESCLVFTGQNASELYNTYRKVAQTMALLNEPVAFMRMLVDSIERWLRSKEIASGAYVPYMRMNVLSDVPWELVAPWLFSHFKNLQFYDYTKVPGRVAPRNYDLTFSISGEEANRFYAEQEIAERHRRIAVVFLGHKRRGESWREYRGKGKKLLKSVPLPETFWSLPVVDGDITDVRPLDPAPCCVGLRWKTPSGKRSGVGEYELQGYSFVVPVYVTSQRKPSRYRQTAAGLEAEGWEGDEPNPGDDDEQWLIAPVTPRYQPIDHDTSQAIDES
jgi:hypothetical protein